VLPAGQATTAVFYSISNCLPGLRGVSFGNFLIKQVVEELSRDLANLKTFVTLSPVPGFRTWLEGELAETASTVLTAEHRESLVALAEPDWHLDPERAHAIEPAISALAAFYLLNVKTVRGRPRDPVARFHLGNGARLERIDPLADISPKGLRQSVGVMVNYLYDLKAIELNHEAYADSGVVAASAAVRRLARSLPVPKLPVPA
jgi:malonyl-CoA decarboxylase